MKTLLDMLTNHWVWGILTLAVLAWYSTITVFVSYKGFHDIKEMLRNLAADHEKKEVHK
jgi:hypothetical protein